MFQNAKELYDKMRHTPNLCGKIQLDGEIIRWDLHMGYQIQISVDPRDTYFNIEQKPGGVKEDQITHWHPDPNEIFDQICNIGLRGNILVIRKNFLWSSVLYMGTEEGCPYSKTKKWSWGKLFYLQAN